MTDGAARQRTRVFFHVGAPKTGTTYLQHRLFKNRAALAADGVLYPYERFGDAFRSMHDFAGTGWGGRGPQQFRGEWDAVARRIRNWDGPTVILSNELFGKVAPDRIKSRLRGLGDVDVHVVFSARDIARQLVSDWQEHIKHKHVVTLEQFVDDLVELGVAAPQPFGEMFWELHDAGRVLDRWGRFVPAAQVHVVTVPQPGAPADTLWQRFAQVTGLDPARYADLGGRSNRSMGVAETELVRRMNRQLRRMPSESYDPLVRRFLAEQALGNRSSRLMLPPHRMDWAVAWSEELVAAIEARGYDVVGDLAELLPRRDDHAAYVSPTSLGDAALAPAATRAATRVLLYSSRQRKTIRELRDQLGDSEASGYRPPSQAEPGGMRPWRGRARALLARLRHHR